MDREYFLYLKNIKKHKKERRLAQKRKNWLSIKRTKRYRNKKQNRYSIYRQLRTEIRQAVLREYIYDRPEKTVVVDYELGCESNFLLDKYLDFSNEIIDANSHNLVIDFTNCPRIWPSAITLLCSLKKWTELASITNHAKHPSISSLSPINEYVEDYLIHCGFYDYVGRKHGFQKINYSDNEIVKIHRETNKSKIIEIEHNFDVLIENYSIFNDEQFELFKCKVIPEIINNVIEHGVSSFDQGWWLLGQYHKRHRVISICIADNGMGIKNNLLSGPQREEIERSIPDVGKNDGEYIDLAFKENVSGAFTARAKEGGIFSKKNKVGEKRGHGLKRVLATCQTCQVPISVFSHYGYIQFTKDGQIAKKGSCKNRIFAGTMYQLTIPAKEV